MVMLYIPKPDLPTSLGWIHEASEWLLGTTPAVNADTAVAKSLADTENLTSITLDYELSPDITYYAKARIICNKSIFESEVGVVKVNDYIEITFKHPIPSKVMTPTVTLDFDNMNVPATMFRVTSDKMSTTSNSKHESTSRIIETLSGEVVFSELYNKDELTSKLMDDIILEGNKAYILKTAYHATSDDSSNFASTVFYVNDYKEIVLTSQAEDLYREGDVSVAIAPIDNFRSMNIKLYEAGLADAKVIYEADVDTLTKVIPSAIFNGIYTGTFLLGISVTKSDNKTIGTKYFKLLIN